MRIVRVLAVVAAGVAVAGAATGITYAATRSSSGTVHACADAKGVLALLNSHGRCPKHFVKVTLNEQGPRGKTGKTGKSGKAGPAGPGAIRLAVKSSNGLVTKESKPIAGSTLTVEVLCNPAADAQVYINQTVAGAPFTFEGTTSWNGSTGAADVRYETPGGGGQAVQAIDGTAKIVAAAQPGDPHSIEFTSDTDTVEANVLFVQGSHMFAVQLAAFTDPTNTSCWSHAMVTPAG